MVKMFSLAALAVCLLLSCNKSQAQNPLAVYPDPANFGIVDENSISYAETFYFSNTTADSLQVTAMTIVGANNGDFAFYGANCVGTIVSNGICEAAMTFSPSAIGARSATLKISVAGVANPIDVPLMGTGGNPLPNISSISPASVYAGSPATKVTLNGTGFLSSSVAYLQNSQVLATTYLSPTQLTVVLPASDLTGQGTSYIYVTNPAPGGGNGADAALLIIALDPSINTVSPPALVSGTPTNPIIISGVNFMNGASVLWNGKPLPTTYLNSGQLQAQLSASQLSKASIAQLSVSNPAPGGVSNAIPFDVTYPSKVLTLDLPANDLVWDPFARRIYASLPSSYGVNGNSIAVINPFNGAVSAYHFAGSEPNQLALSSDGQYLYVGLNGSDSVQRFILPAFTPDINVSLNTSTNEFMAGSLAVSPANPHMFAVTLSGGGCCSSGGPLEFFEDAKPLADEITNYQFTSIVFPTATTLYGYQNGSLSTVTVGSTGGKLGKQWFGLVDGNDIQYDAGLIYGSAGQTFNPATDTLVGTFDVGTEGCCSSNQLLPDAPINRAFALGITSFFSSFGITSYNLSEFTPIAVTNLEQLSGSTTPAFLRWGSDGLAFVITSGCCGTNTSQVVLVQSPAMLLTAGAGSNPAPSVTSLTPASAQHGGGNLIVTIDGTGFVPGSEVTWSGKQLTVAYLNATQVQVYVPAADIASAGTASVVVTNPPPVGGSSTGKFTIN